MARTSAAPPPPARVTPWWQRLLLLVGAPLLFLLAAEGALRLLGIGSPTDFFIPDEKPGYYRTNPAFTAPFFPENFSLRPLNFRLARAKPAGTYRVFVLGESAAQGTPEPALGFAAQLRAQLAHALPDRHVEVFNCGITAINSHVVLEVARQLPDFAPDAVVVYLGNNEVIGPYGPGSVNLPTAPPRWLIRAGIRARQLRLGQLLHRAAQRLGENSTRDLTWKGMETFAASHVRADDPRLATVYAHFAANLRDIIAVSGRSGARVVVSTVVANLADCSPFVSVHRADLAGAELAAWSTAFDEGKRAWQMRDVDRAEAALTRALQLDPQYADTHFLLGRLALARGDVATARREFVAALEWDALRFRPVPHLNEIIRRTASSANVRLIDPAKDLGSDPTSTETIAGREWLFEHVHFNWVGNANLARRFAAQVLSPEIGFLDDAVFADALGYTPHWRTTAAEKMLLLTGKAPFTGQLTYRETQERLRAEALEARRATSLADTTVALDRAFRLDPDNAALAVQSSFVALERRDLPGALAWIDRAIALQPPSAVLLAHKANLLQQQRRFADAEALLLDAVREDPFYAPTWQLLALGWAAQNELARGQTFLAAQLAARPANIHARAALAMLHAQRGDAAASEAAWRDVLRLDPSNPNALEQLTQLLERRGDSAALFALLRDGARTQPRNYANNARLAQACQDRGDAAGTADALRALIESGPVDAALHLTVARLLAQLGQRDDALVYAHHAARLADEEQNAPVRAAARALQRQLAPP
ncbi:MAG: tetratricopeptide repeat protein [Opitutae bacterium]|nr:tetratricopeptide repeat protein [Opitutae bacterium]